MTITDLDDGLTSALLAERARRRHTEAAELVEYVLIHRLPTRAVPDGQPRAPRGSSTASAPLNLSALDDADELVSTLLDRAHRWRTTLGIVDRPRIRSLRYAYQVPLGFRPETTPAGARQSMEGITGWLLLHHDDIARHPSSGAYFARSRTSSSASTPDSRSRRAPTGRTGGDRARCAASSPSPRAGSPTQKSATSPSGASPAPTSSSPPPATAPSTPRAPSRTSRRNAPPARSSPIVKEVAVGTTIPRIEEVANGQ